jgi:hypothetical protein
MKIIAVRFLSGILAIVLGGSAIAEEGASAGIRADLQSGLELQEVANRAHGQLPAGDAVRAIFNHAHALGAEADPAALDVLRVSLAVIDAWTECEDTFEAVRAAVALMPERAGDIVATVAVKRNCNCDNGGLWLDQRVDERIRVERRHAILDAPLECSCSQVAMRAGIAGLPEDQAYNDQLPEAEKAALVARMAEQVAVIIQRTAELQSLDDWECGCTDINIAAAMQGIGHADLRDRTYLGLTDEFAAAHEGEMPMHCHASALAYLRNYPPLPFIRLPNGRLLSAPQPHEIASPN